MSSLRVLRYNIVLKFFAKERNRIPHVCSDSYHTQEPLVLISSVPVMQQCKIPVVFTDLVVTSLISF